MQSRRTREAWSREQNAAIVSDYFDALELELMGQPFNKAARNRALVARIGRSRGAIELKHPNISHVLQQLGFPIIDGYQPRSNVQEVLYGVVAAEIEKRPRLLHLIESMGVARSDGELRLVDHR